MQEDHARCCVTIATVKAIIRSGDVVPFEIARSIARLWKTESVIGPGGACTQAALRFLHTGDWTSCGAPAGQAGNGTAMRTAVLGLFFVCDAERLPDTAAAVSRITHQDARSVAGGVAIAKAAQLLVCGNLKSSDEFCNEIAQATLVYEPSFAGMIRKLPLLLNQTHATAVNTIAWSGMQNPEFEKPIITPFVIPTVLAALWCNCLHPDSWKAAVSRAIGLGGDVDTLGAIVGALMGAKLGLQAIPAHLTESVVGSRKLQSLAIRYQQVVCNSRGPENA
jgi:ADP-ribosyl-[dinitrogen reductase] hydrolase